MEPSSNTGFQKLKLSEDAEASVGDVHFRFLAETLPHIIWSAEASGRLDYFNQRGLEYFQCELDILRAWENEGLVHPDDQMESLNRWRLSKQTGEALEVEARLLRGSDSSWRWHVVRALPQKSREGAIIRWFGTCTDIQDRKETEAKLQEATRKLEGGLRESQERFAAFMEDNPAVAWMKDEAGRYVYVNKTLEREYEMSAARVLGRTDFDLLSEPVAKLLRANDRRVIETWQSLTVIESIPSPSGKMRAWQIWKFPFRDIAGGRYVGGLTFDISERLHAEETLRVSEARYRSLVDNARDSIFTLSATGEIASLNPGFEAITGWSAADWLGKHFPPLVHPEDVSTAMDIFRRSLDGEVMPTFELRIATSSGGYVPMEFKIATRRDAGGVVDVLGIGRDILERRRLEEQLRQMQKLDSIGQLAAGIAHDFNNLLNVQKVHVELMLMDTGLPEERIQALREISDATERAAALTRQLLLFSRRQVMQSQPLKLDEIVAQLARMLERILGENIVLVCERGLDLPRIYADPGMTEQILMNLVLNARDAMPNGGRLTVSTQSIELTREVARRNPEARAGEFVRLTVKDTGTGMAAEILDQIFDPFFTTKDVGKGIGLGLSTVHGIVKQHHGWIEVDSALNEGTTFKVYFPAIKTEERKSDPEKNLKELGGRCETILLVEDEDPLRRIMRIFLEKQGYRVVTAACGDEGLKEWKAHPGGIDLLLTDLAMPGGMTGQELAGLLRQENPQLRVVFTSGYSSDLAGEEWVVDDRSRFLQKPFLPQDLIQRVRELLDQ